MRTPIENSRVLVKFLTGSHLYGTNTPTSDKDYVGVFMPCEEELLGLRGEHIIEDRTNKSSSGKRNTPDDTDCVWYSLHKFAELARQNNPNIIELFFAPERNIVFASQMGKELLVYRDLFLSTRCYNTFRGYAESQRHKLERKGKNMTGRKELAVAHGYDTKFGMHLVRLLIQGTQLLTEGFIKFPLEHARTLMDIREGRLDFRALKHTARHWEGVMDTAYAGSRLPPYKDTFKPINKLVVSLTREYLDCGGVK